MNDGADQRDRRKLLRGGALVGAAIDSWDCTGGTCAKWREYAREDTLRFDALRLHEAA